MKRLALSTPPHKDLPDELAARVAHRLDRELSRVLVTGGVLYLTVAVLTRSIVAPEFDALLPTVMNGFLVATIISLVIRVFCQFGFDEFHGWNPVVWRWSAAASTMLIALGWGLLSGYVLWLAPESMVAMLVTLVAAGIAVGISLAFAHMLPVCLICLLMLLLPLIYGMMRHGGTLGLYASLAFAIFCFYLIILGYTRYQETWDRATKTLLLSNQNNELRRLAEELERSHGDAEKASNAKSQFIANTSHELRTPLHSILGNAELLQAGGLPKKHHDQAGAILLAGRSLLNLVDELIDVSRIEAGQLKVEIAAVALRALVEEIDAEMRMAAEENGLKLECIVEDRAPAWVAIDAQRLRQIILNLVNNAIKYTDTGRVRVMLSYDHESRSIEGYVSDTGPGLPPDRRDDIFEEFVQLENSASRGYQGVGLGLAISRRLVRAMRGRIGVDSSPGIGSTFWFSLPATEVDAPKSRRPAAREERDNKTTPARVLVVDDNHSNRLMVADQIRLLGHQCESVSSGPEAIETLGASGARFDLVLMDCQMPGMDGYEAVQHIRQLDGRLGEVPVVALTANAMTEERARCLQAGMDDYVSKPVSINGLSEVIGRWHGKRATATDGPSAPDAQARDPSSSASIDAPPMQAAARSRSVDRAGPEQGQYDTGRLNELRRLRSDLGESSLQTAFEAFCSGVDERLGQLALHVDSADYRAAARDCHALKGMLLEFGVLDLSNRVADLEELALEGQLTADLVRERASRQDYTARMVDLAQRLSLDQSPVPGP